MQSNNFNHFLETLSLAPTDILGIDGPCGSGKTTLANHIANLYDVDVIHLDDFFLPLELRTSSRLSEIGGNVHYERFYTQVIQGILDIDSTTQEQRLIQRVDNENYKQFQDLWIPKVNAYFRKFQIREIADILL